MQQFHFKEYNLNVFNSIHEFDKCIWEKNISENHPFKNIEFLDVLEKSFKNRKFAYVTVLKGGIAVAATILTLDQLDLVLTANRWVKTTTFYIRKLYKHFLYVPLITSGTFETVGPHWWWSENDISAEDFAAILEDISCKIFPEGKLFVIRDFFDKHSQYKVLEQALNQHGFISIDNLPLAVVYTNGLNGQEHANRLRKKVRATIRTLDKLKTEYPLYIETIDDFSQVVEDIYPLYLNVHNAAEDFIREQIPIEFFYNLAKKDNTHATVVRLKDNKIIGFILTGYNQTISNAYLLGIDYSYNKETLLYHQLIWYEISRAASAGCEEIDLGLTSYFVKQKYGATLEEMRIKIRFQDKILRLWFNKFIPLMFKVKVPETHRKYSLPSTKVKKRESKRT